MNRSIADRSTLPLQTGTTGAPTLIAALLMLAILAAAIAGISLLAHGAPAMDDPTALLFATG